MKSLFFTLLICSVCFAEIVKSLENFKWKNRLIVVRQDPERVEKQQYEFKDQDGFNDRLMKIVQLSDDHEFFENYSNSNFFLVGKDGIIKAHAALPLGQKYLFDLIDTMPMRIYEIREKKEKESK